MRPEASGQSPGRRALPNQPRNIEPLVALLGLATVLSLVGGGVGWLWHPGAGMAAAGILLYIDLQIWSRTGGKR